MAQRKTKPTRHKAKPDKTPPLRVGKGGARRGAGRKIGQVGWIHALSCVAENEIWVGELLNWRVQRLMLKPGSPTAKR